MKYRVVEAKRNEEIKGGLKSNYIAGHIQYKYTKESSLKKMVGLNFYNSNIHCLSEWQLKLKDKEMLSMATNINKKKGGVTISI